MEKRIITKSGKKSVRKERCYENRKQVDGKGRVLIPKSMREAAKLEYGDIVCLGMAGGKITVRKVEVIEVGDQSPEAVEAYVRTAFQFMPDSLRLDLIGELSRLLQKKEG